MEPTKATLIPPAVGRICHFIRFHPDTREHLAIPEAAIITAVHGDRCINCQVFGADGRNNNYTSMTLLQPGDVAPERDYCRWMEYQVGQAQKTAELQEKLMMGSLNGEIVQVDRPPQIPPASAEEKPPALSGV